LVTGYNDSKTALSKSEQTLPIPLKLRLLDILGGITLTKIDSAPWQVIPINYSFILN
jgi:hypothetical protein